MVELLFEQTSWVRIKTTKDFPQISQIHVKVHFEHGYTLMLEMVIIVSRNIS
jgi:hypothetical protein